jgi:hypothetical protein
VSGQRKALIVANDEYENEGLRRLLAPAADAEALRRVLGDPQIGDFDVHVVHNQPAHAIQAQVDDFLSDSRPEDLLLLHFSCHGLKSDSGELFFAASNTRLNRLDSTAVPADFVQRRMRASRSRRIVLLLDCCYGGAFAQGVTVRAAGDVNVLDSFPDSKLGGGRGRAVITASTAMEYAFEGEQLADGHAPQPSVFTQAVVDGLATGDADRDEDGEISLNELYDYVFDKVREQNPHQTPSRNVEMQGELYVAHSQRKRIRAAPLPPDLEAARKDQNMYTRRGAVNELRSRLLGDDLPAAVGAWEALTELAGDIRYVADEARAALQEAVVHPAESELHFGQLTQGSPPQHQIAHLLGPPIARACRLKASHKWIHIKETAEGFDISVDVGQVGPLTGLINIKGPTGEIGVTVQAEIIPAPLTPPVSTQVTDAIPEPSPVPSHTPSVSEIHAPDEPTAHATAEVSDLAQHLGPGRSQEAGGRSIRAEQTAGPLTFKVTDKDGERTYSEVRQLPAWVVRELIEHYTTFPEMHGGRVVDGNAYNDVYSWLKALLAAQKHPEIRGSFGSGHEIDVKSSAGPLRYIVYDGQTEQAYASLTDVPDIDQFEPALVENARQEMESLRKSERRTQIQRRLDELLKASESPQDQGDTDQGEPKFVQSDLARLSNEDADRKAWEEAERHTQGEAKRQAQEDAVREADEDAARRAREQEARRAREDPTWKAGEAARLQAAAQDFLATIEKVKAGLDSAGLADPTGVELAAPPRRGPDHGVEPSPPLQRGETVQLGSIFGDSIPQSRWTAHAIKSSTSTRALSIQLSDETHTLEIKKRGIIRETDSVLLDGRVIIRRLDVGFKVYTFPISDGRKMRSADLCVTSDTAAGTITDVRLIVNGSILYQEP